MQFGTINGNAYATHSALMRLLSWRCYPVDDFMSAMGAARWIRTKHAIWYGDVLPHTNYDASNFSWGHTVEHFAGRGINIAAGLKSTGSEYHESV